MSFEPVNVLIADDEPMVLGLMESILSERRDCRLTLARDGSEALRKFLEVEPDLLITDLRMPFVGGEDLAIRALDSRPETMVLIVTGNGSVESAVKLVKEGVFDYITKPFRVEEFTRKVDRAIEGIRSGKDSLESHAIVTSLMAALEAKDSYLKNHSARVAGLAQSLGGNLGLSRQEVRRLYRAGLVHDLGKIGVPEAILNKPGPLSPTEFEEIKKHPLFSANIVRPLREFRDCIREVYHHHERLDGSGYPSGLAGSDIPLGSRIIAVCDAFDAMTSHRAYRSAVSGEEAAARLEAGRGSQFDADIVDLFIEKLRR
jgi:putative two-component system response regulator